MAFRNGAEICYLLQPGETLLSPPALALQDSSKMISVTKQRDKHQISSTAFNQW